MVLRHKANASRRGFLVRQYESQSVRMSHLLIHSTTVRTDLFTCDQMQTNESNEERTKAKGGVNNRMNESHEENQEMAYYHDVINSNK